MLAIDRFILLIRDLRRNERGIAVPTALMALVASFAIASVAVMSTVDVQQGTKRDHDSKEAIAAADAGANIALLRLNRYDDLDATSRTTSSSVRFLSVQRDFAVATVFHRQD